MAPESRPSHSHVMIGFYKTNIIKKFNNNTKKIQKKLEDILNKKKKKNKHLEQKKSRLGKGGIN